MNYYRYIHQRDLLLLAYERGEITFEEFVQQTKQLDKEFDLQ